MREYSIKENGVIKKYQYIGLNYLLNNTIYENTLSSYNKEFDDLDEVIIDNTRKSIRYCTIGDIKEAYLILKDEIVAKRPGSIFEYALCVQQTVAKYFGNYTSKKMRFNYFPTINEIMTHQKKMGKVSDLAHKNIALSIERSMLAHNLLCEIGISDVFKMSLISIDGKIDVHAYNLINHDSKNYLFDASIPSFIDSTMTPIVGEIPNEVYQEMSKPFPNSGCSIIVKHFNPWQNNEYEMIYDVGKDMKYQLEKNKTK